MRCEHGHGWPGGAVDGASVGIDGLGGRGDGIIKSLLMELVIDSAKKISDGGGFDYYC